MHGQICNLASVYGTKAAGWGKSALTVLKTSSLGEFPWPNRLCYQRVLLDSWETLGGAPTHKFSHSFKNFKKCLKNGLKVGN